MLLYCKELVVEPLLRERSVCNEKSLGTKMYSKTFFAGLFGVCIMSASFFSAFKKTIRHSFRVPINDYVRISPTFARNSYLLMNREAVFLKKNMAIVFWSMEVYA